MNVLGFKAQICEEFGLKMILSEEDELEKNSSAQSKNKPLTFDFQSQIHSICYNRIHFAEQKRKKKVTKVKRNKNRG